VAILILGGIAYCGEVQCERGQRLGDLFPGGVGASVLVGDYPSGVLSGGWGEYPRILCANFDQNAVG